MRYVIKMEIEATIDCQDQSPDADCDALTEMDQMLQDIENEIDDCSNIPVFERKHYDLCPECYKEFIKNPLAREKVIPFGFSHN